MAVDGKVDHTVGLVEVDAVSASRLGAFGQASVVVGPVGGVGFASEKRSAWVAENFLGALQIELLVIES